jgi:hypothetical protein
VSRPGGENNPGPPHGEEFPLAGSENAARWQTKPIPLPARDIAADGHSPGARLHRKTARLTVARTAS